MKYQYIILLILFYSCKKSNPTIEITENVVQGDNIDISIHGLDTSKEYTVHFQQYSFKGEKSYNSTAKFISDKNGVINIDKDASVGGDYIGNDSLALFYLLNKENDLPSYISSIQQIENTHIANNYFSIYLSENANVLVSKTFSTIVLNQDVEVFSYAEDGIKLDLYYKTTHNKTVVVFGGSEGNNESSKYIAQLLASKGVNAVAISYFGGEGQSYSLDQIPLELINESLEISQQKMGKSTDLFFLGWSKGAELALLYASLMQDEMNNGVIAFAPSSTVFQGLNGVASSWTLNEKEVNYALFTESMNLTTDENNKVIYKDYYLDAFENNEDPLATIQVENIRSDILLFYGEDDNVWPSALMSNQIVDRLSSLDYKYNVEIFSYANAGHSIFPPPYTSQLTLESSPFSLGGTTKENAYAQLDAWNKTIDFLFTK